MQNTNERLVRVGQPGGASAARNPSVNEKVNEFVQKNRKPIFVFIGIIVVALIGFIAALSVMDKLNAKAISAVEELGTRYGTLYPNINEDFTAVDVEELLADIEAFAKKNSGFLAKKNSGYAAGKAWSIAGSINADKKNWAESEAAWAAAAAAAKGTYLASVAFFNAGVAAENQEKAEEAIDYYTLCLAADDFSDAPRAQFAIGRLHESMNENAEAIEAYREIEIRWPYARVWSSLAKSRIIALEIE